MLAVSPIRYLKGTWMYYRNWIQSLSAQWRMKQKWFGFPGLKTTGSDAALLLFRTSDSSSSSVCNSSRAIYFWFNAPLARMGIKQSNRVALLDFPSVIRPNESNPDGTVKRVTLRQFGYSKEIIHSIT